VVVATAVVRAASPFAFGIEGSMATEAPNALVKTRFRGGASVSNCGIARAKGVLVPLLQLLLLLPPPLGCTAAAGMFAVGEVESGTRSEVSWSEVGNNVCAAFIQAATIFEPVASPDDAGNAEALTSRFASGSATVFGGIGSSDSGELGSLRLPVSALCISPDTAMVVWKAGCSGAVTPAAAVAVDEACVSPERDRRRPLEPGRDDSSRDKPGRERAAAATANGLLMFGICCMVGGRSGTLLWLLLLLLLPLLPAAAPMNRS
jgi:hypothetical protein